MAELVATTLYIAIITTINSFQCFALIQLLTSGGPNYSTSTLMYYLYEKAFKLSEYGYANTMGVFLAVMIAIIAVLFMIFFRVIRQRNLRLSKVDDRDIAVDTRGS